MLYIHPQTLFILSHPLCALRVELKSAVLIVSLGEREQRRAGFSPILFLDMNKPSAGFLLLYFLPFIFFVCVPVWCRYLIFLALVWKQSRCSRLLQKADMFLSERSSRRSSVVELLYCMTLMDFLCGIRWHSGFC